MAGPRRRSKRSRSTAPRPTHRDRGRLTRWPVAGAHPATADQERRVDEEDHARHGADRRHPGGQGPGAGRRGSPLQRADHQRHPRPGRLGAGARHPLLAGPFRGQGWPSSSSSPTAACAVPTTRRSSAPPSVRSRPTPDEGNDYSLFLVGKKAETYFRFRSYRIDDAFLVLPTGPPTRMPARSAALFTSVRGRRAEGLDLVYTRFISAGTQQLVVRRFLPLEVEDSTGDGESGPTADLEFEPVARASSTSCCRATSRPGSSRPCSTPRPPSTPPASGP